MTRYSFDGDGVTEERNYYDTLRMNLVDHLRVRFTPIYSDPRLQIYAKLMPPSQKIHLEITAGKGLSNLLKSKIPSGRDLIYSFLRSAQPDLTGFIEVQSSIEFIVVEFKDSSLSVDDIYQLKKYADLLDAKYSLLVSTHEIPVEVKRLASGVIPDLLTRGGGYRQLTLVHYDFANRSFLEWIPEDPFPAPSTNESLEPPLKIKFAPQSSNKTAWKVPIEIENVSQYNIRIHEILVNGASPDLNRIRLEYSSEQFLTDGRLVENNQTYLFDIAAQSKIEASLLIAKKGHYKTGDEFRLDLRLDDNIVYPGGTFKLSYQDTTRRGTGILKSGRSDEPRSFEYNAFICHAGEDKKDVAEPLAKLLMQKGLKVWLDEFALRVGDSLRQKIDYGLANSRYGIVILSPFFFKKNWPQKELDGLAAREDSEGHKVILPVWHGVDRDYVLKYSPTLADRLASNTTKGMQTVLAEILEVLLESMPKIENQTVQEDTELSDKRRTAEVATVTQQEGRRWLIEPLTREQQQRQQRQRLSRSFPLILRTVESLTKEDSPVKEEDIIFALQDELNRNEALALIQLMLKEGVLYQPKPGHVMKTVV